MIYSFTVISFEYVVFLQTKEGYVQRPLRRAKLIQDIQHYQYDKDEKDSPENKEKHFEVTRS